MKLIRLDSDRFVIVSEEKLKKGDWFLTKDNMVHNNFGWNFGDRKITHSTQVSLLDESEQKAVIKLDLSEVKRLVGEADWRTNLGSKGIDSMFAAEKLNSSWGGPQWTVAYHDGYKDGYNQCLQERSEKSYTEADLRSIFMHGFLLGVEMPEYSEDMEERAISNYSPQIEWEVEFDEHGKLKFV